MTTALVVRPELPYAATVTGGPTDLNGESSPNCQIEVMFNLYGNQGALAADVATLRAMTLTASSKQFKTRRITPGAEQVYAVWTLTGTPTVLRADLVTLKAQSLTCNNATINWS